MQERTTHSTIFLYYLVMTAAISGAMVMVIEILGSRVIGPFFGVSLFVWTSLITVTLVSLAAGYTVGGMLSDRRSSPDYLYGIILASGCLATLVPLVKGPLLTLFIPLGLRMGSMLSSTMIFGPSLFLLGCVSPYIVKIAAKEIRSIGRTVGVFYAISTVGSFVGTVLTGFFLIAYFGVDRIFAGVGLTLICLSIGYFVFFRKKLAFLLFALSLAVLLRPEPSVSVVRPDGTKVTIIYSEESFYGKLKVVDRSYGNIHTRELLIDGFPQSNVDLATGQSTAAYPYLLEIIPYALNPSGKTCLVIGLGAGVVPMWYESRGIRADVIDIDPHVVRIARDFFGFSVSGRIFVEDARFHLGRTKSRYDYLIVDVFNGDITPSHLLSVEALRLIKSRLTDEGIVAMNIVGSIREKIFMTASIIRTVKEVFRTVKVYAAFNPKEGDGTGNLIIIAYDSAPRKMDMDIVRNFSRYVHPFSDDSAKRFSGVPVEIPSDVGAMVLTDNYNPVDFYDRWLKERVRSSIIRDTMPEVLL